MCGSATLAMVVSSACMIVASMTETVISAAMATPSLGDRSAAAGAWALTGRP